MGNRTFGIRCQLYDIADPDVDNSKEALVLLLEFLLVKHLDG